MEDKKIVSLVLNYEGEDIEYSFYLKKTESGNGMNYLYKEEVFITLNSDKFDTHVSNSNFFSIEFLPVSANSQYLFECTTYKIYPKGDKELLYNAVSNVYYYLSLRGGREIYFKKE